LVISLLKKKIATNLGSSETFGLDEVKSQYILPRLKTFFSNKTASVYQPIIYRSDEIFDNADVHDDRHDTPATYAKGIYYRIVYDLTGVTHCIQYYL
jgi:hypothetical protein